MAKGRGYSVDSQALAEHQALAEFQALAMTAPTLHALLLAEGAAPAAGNPLGGMLPMVLVLVVAYFLLIRPMSKDEKTRKTRVGEIKKGTEVVLQGGIIGRISNFDDPHVAVVELADKVKIRVLKRDIQDVKEHVLGALEGKNKKASGDKK